MTAQEVALQSYQLFKNGDIEGLKACVMMITQ